MRILLIDDEEDMRLVAAMSLGEVGGMTVIEASGGAEGLSRAAEEQPDLILLDMIMPGMDGEATFMALRDRPETRDIPVILLTGSDMDEQVERLRALGVRGVLHKPFDPMTLADDVRATLGAA